jgi:hypothetical protein
MSGWGAFIAGAFGHALGRWPWKPLRQRPTDSDLTFSQGYRLIRAQSARDAAPWLRRVGLFFMVVGVVIGAVNR